jgi:hypothetical protein
LILDKLSQGRKEGHNGFLQAFTVPPLLERGQECR